MNEEQYTKLKDRVDSISVAVDEIRRIHERTPIEHAFQTLDDRLERMEQAIEKITDMLGSSSPVPEAGI